MGGSRAGRALARAAEAGGPIRHDLETAPTEAWQCRRMSNESAIQDSSTSMAEVSATPCWGGCFCGKGASRVRSRFFFGNCTNNVTSDKARTARATNKGKCRASSGNASTSDASTLSPSHVLWGWVLVSPQNACVGVCLRGCDCCCVESNGQCPANDDKS